MRWNVLFAFILVCLSCQRALYGVVAMSHINITGDFIVGAMFPVHVLKGGGQCGTEINDQDGMQNLEAFLYTLHKINDNKFFDGFTLGALIEDTCYSDTVALDKALAFVKQHVQTTEIEKHAWKCADNSVPNYTASGTIIGVVGAATSIVSIQLASFLRLFNVPQISYMSTSPELSDTKRYGYFLRTVPSDVHQASAIVEILSKFNWTYVTGIYEDTSYGVQGFDEIRKQSEKRGLCIAYSSQIKRYYDTEDEKRRELDLVVNELSKYNNTEGKIIVIVFASFGIVETLFDSVHNHTDNRKKFIWVGGDAWSGRIFKSKEHEMVAENTIAVQPLVKIIPEFDEYFKGLTPNNHKEENPWFMEYWTQLFNCTESDPGPSRGKDNPRLPVCEMDKHRLDSKLDNRNLNTYSTMDALMAYAHALKELHAVKCGAPGACAALKNVSGQELLHQLQQTTFIDEANLEFKFVGGREGPARYSITSYVYTQEEGYHWVEVGQFIDIEGDMNTTEDHIQWNETVTSLAQYRPSMCSAECARGQSRSQKKRCCWTCVQCGSYQIVKVPDDVCMTCGQGYLPNNFRNACAPIPEMYMSYGDLWAIIALFLSCLGMALTVMIAVVFYKNRETPVIMASGKELSFVLLGGIFASYLSSFLFVAYPTGFTCGATRMLLGVCYTLCYAAILVKTNRIYRVFNIRTNKPKKVRFTSAKSQLIITVAIVTVEFAALVAWLVFEPPTTTHIYPSKEQNILVCKDSKDFSYLGALVYPFLLMIMCMVYAVRTRKTPDGFNETKHIAFGSYSFCVMWLAFIPIYFTVSDNTIRVICLCLASVVNASVTLITLFMTKAYLVIFRPQKNTRENVMSRRRMHSYETVDVNNLSNLSRIAGAAVSTWNSSYNPSLQSEDSGSSTHVPKPFVPRFGNELSVSVISPGTINQSLDSVESEASTSSAPENTTDIDISQKKPKASNSDGDLLDHTKDDRNISNGYKQHKFARFRSFKPLPKKKVEFNKRHSSVDVVPSIVVTESKPTEGVGERL